jgi:hypothetical protein
MKYMLIRLPYMEIIVIKVLFSQFQEGCSCQGGEGKWYTKATSILQRDEGSEW